MLPQSGALRPVSSAESAAFSGAVEASPRHRLLLSHETWHTRQWAIFGGGLGFPILYSLETLRTGGDECRNVFERWAGREDGGYKCGC
jgi:hypothetical protein